MEGCMAASPRGTIFVVEDEWLVAEQMARDIRKAGFEVLGPAHSCRSAMELLSTVTPSLAVLDIGLRKDNSFEVADVLYARGVPFLFTTGYTAEDLPERFASRPFLAKPFATETLLVRLTELLHARDHGSSSFGGAQAC
jgi:DNA-binding response OmpR family regulator